CACGGPAPLPAPSRNRGSAPDPLCPQAPDGLDFGALPRTPLLNRRRG
ncbi:polysaccharide deacetylase, partial [Streptomyces parvus]